MVEQAGRKDGIADPGRGDEQDFHVAGGLGMPKSRSEVAESPMAVGYTVRFAGLPSQPLPRPMERPT
jgi:hypothetical protein